MNKECYVCGKKLSNGYLCDDHILELVQMLNLNVDVMKEHDFRHHCIICGQFEERKIIYYKGLTFICSVCIDEHKNKYLGLSDN